jgi:Lectin C-type domain
MVGKYHWTSGSDQACPFNFRWCTSTSYFGNTSINWSAGQPNNAFGLHDCVQLMLTTGLASASTYDDQPCNFASYFICEVKSELKKFS